MKAFRLIGMALVAMCLCMNFVSCSNEDVVAPEDPQEEKYVTVGLGCTGEFLEFSESAMGRAATDELYGIQVYALTERGTHDDGSIYYNKTPYAYGLFSSLDNVKIRLLQGQKYKFEVSVAIDPFKTSNEIYPWFHLTENGYLLGTEFTYSSSKEIYTRHVWSNVDYDQYNHDRYYGELNAYEPEANKNVSINTKRVVYGVKYETLGLKPNESITVEVNKYESNLYNINLNTEPYESIYTFSNIDYAWAEYSGNRYTSEKQLTINWNKADGSIVPMGTYTVTFKRNVKTTIRIHAEDLNLENGIKVYKEETPMADDEYIYDITGGKVEEVPVNSGN